VAERVLSAIARVAPSGVDIKAPNTETQDDDEELESAAQRFIVRIVDDECEISADSSGELLHRRGYRKEVAKAPLRETLAAAMVLASGWNGKRGEPLLDPMCGSGTIPIEAALLARGIAPGLNRDFQFMHWPASDVALWKDIVEKARNSVTSPSLEIRGADRDAGANLAATHNAERAGVASDISFSVQSLSGSIADLEDLTAGEGWMLANPPYGVRVGDSDDLRDLYATLGKAVKTKIGWRMGILTSDAVLAGQMRVPIRPRFSSSNGGIPVSFLVTEKVGKAEVRSLQSEVRGLAGGTR
jgi:putative N6-adenine-specific DNA methylase